MSGSPFSSQADLTTVKCGATELAIIARTSVMAYKGMDKKIDDIGRELQVGTILEGSVRKAGDTLRITVQLIDVASQAHVWSHDYDRELKDVFAIQSDVAQQVAEALHVELLAEEQSRIAKKTTANLEAYDLYLKGLYHWNKQTKQGIEQGKGYFEQAIDTDPAYARAYVGLGFSYSSLGWFGYLPAKEAYSQSEIWAIKALELDDTLAEAHTLLATYKTEYAWGWAGGEHAYKRALALSPNYTTAHWWYGHTYLQAMGKHDDAIAEMQRAVELDPLSMTLNAELGWTFLLARQYEQAIAQCQNTLEMEPNTFLAQWCLGWAYTLKGSYEEALVEMQKTVDLTGSSPIVVASLGWAYAVAGETDEALKVLNELQEQSHFPLIIR